MSDLMIAGLIYFGLIGGLIFINYRFWNHICPWAEYELEEQRQEETENEIL